MYTDIIARGLARLFKTQLDVYKSRQLSFVETSQLRIPLINRTGSPTVKGTVVSVSPLVDLAFDLQRTQFDAIGVVADSGIADGQIAWIIIQGIADVLLENGTPSTRGYFVFGAVSDGRANATQIIPEGGTITSINEHFKEIGHCLESKSAGTNVLCKVNIHFN